MPETIEESVHRNHLDLVDYDATHIRLGVRSASASETTMALSIHELHFLCEALANARRDREPRLTALQDWAEGALKWAARNPGKVLP